MLNNVPIDVMQRLNHDGPIIAVNVFPDVDMLRDYHFGPSISGWQALAAKLNPLHRRDRSAPLIFESLLRVLALNAEIGYRSAIDALSDWEELRGREGAPPEMVPAPGTASPIPGDSISAPLHQALAELEELLARMD